MSLDIQVQQSTPNNVVDGLSSNLASVYARANRRGELVVPEHVFQMVSEGRAFCAANPTVGTAVAAGGLSFSATAPAFSVDVPAGTVLIPLAISLAQAGTVAGGPITVAMVIDQAIRYSSSGAAITSKPMRSDAPVAQNCTWYSNATVAAAVTPITFWSALINQSVTTTANSTQSVYLTRYNSALPVLVGPASLIIYTYAATTQPSWLFNFTWAEYAKSVVV